MTGARLKILLIEGDEDEYLVARGLLGQIEAWEFDLDRVADYDAALAAVQRNAHDVCLCGDRAGGHTGLEVLRRAAAGGFPAPIILLAGQEDRAADLAAMRAGAADYLVMGQLRATALERSIRYAVERRRAERGREERSRRLEAQQSQLQQTADSLVKANSLLEHASHRFEELFQGLPIACFCYDAEGRIFEWNRACEALYGLRAEDVLLKTIWETISRPEDAQRTRDMVARVFAGESFEGLEWEEVRPDNATRHMLCNTFPLRWLDGEIIGAISANVDVTERYRRRQLEIKDQFLSHVSHELRSPLTTVYQFVTILLDGLAGDLTPEQREYLEITLRSVNQLRGMIGDLLDVTRAEAGKLVVEPQSVRPATLVAETLQTLQPSAGAKRLALRADLPGDLPAVHADPDRVRQVLTNLIENAIKFTPEGGEITVRAGVSAQDPGFLSVAVADTGCGISPKGTRQIFERLHQEANTIEDSRKGLGLGLYICKELVSRHGGRIWVDSELGRGSVFCFTLPLCPGT